MFHSEPNGRVQTGTVKFYMTVKGYGFITPEGCDSSDKAQDRFFHHSQLNVITNGFTKTGKKPYKTIKTGTRVLFTPIENEKGLAAMNVTPI